MFRRCFLGGKASPEPKQQEQQEDRIVSRRNGGSDTSAAEGLPLPTTLATLAGEESCQAAVTPQRDYCKPNAGDSLPRQMFDNTPFLVTAISAAGTGPPIILYQNILSVQYHGGSLVSGSAAGSSSSAPDLMTQLFSIEGLQAQQEMLEAVRAGTTCTRVMRVPPPASNNNIMPVTTTGGLAAVTAPSSYPSSGSDATTTPTMGNDAAPAAVSGCLSLHASRLPALLPALLLAGGSDGGVYLSNSAAAAASSRRRLSLMLIEGLLHRQHVSSSSSFSGRLINSPTAAIRGGGCNMPMQNSCLLGAITPASHHSSSPPAAAAAPSSTFISDPSSFKNGPASSFTNYADGLVIVGREASTTAGDAPPGAHNRPTAVDEPSAAAGRMAAVFRSVQTALDAARHNNEISCLSEESTQQRKQRLKILDGGSAVSSDAVSSCKPKSEGAAGSVEVPDGRLHPASAEAQQGQAAAAASTTSALGAHSRHCTSSASLGGGGESQESPREPSLLSSTARSIDLLIVDMPPRTRALVDYANAKREASVTSSTASRRPASTPAFRHMGSSLSGSQGAENREDVLLHAEGGGGEDGSKPRQDEQLLLSSDCSPGSCDATTAVPGNSVHGSDPLLAPAGAAPLTTATAGTYADTDAAVAAEATPVVTDMDPARWRPLATCCEEAAEGDDSIQASKGAPIADTPAFIWHEVTASPFTDRGGRPAILLTQRDVTARIAAENMLAGLLEGQLSMLSGLFPRHVIEYFSTHHDAVPEHMGQLARTHEGVTILFMDIVGFTSMSKEVEAQAVMTFLNQLFTLFDSICDAYGVQKLETAGDCYIAAAGIASPDECGYLSVDGAHNERQSAHSMVAFAKQMMALSKQVTMPHNGQPVQIRIGMHTGPCVTGLVGFKLPKFTIFGDTMNTASRMESTSIPGFIQVSEATYKFLDGQGDWIPTEGVEVKGKGQMNTFLYSAEKCMLEAAVAEYARTADPTHSRNNMSFAAPIAAGSLLADGGAEKGRQRGGFMEPLLEGAGGHAAAAAATFTWEHDHHSLLPASSMAAVPSLTRGRAGSTATSVHGRSPLSGSSMTACTVAGAAPLSGMKHASFAPSAGGTCETAESPPDSRGGCRISSHRSSSNTSSCSFDPGLVMLSRQAVALAAAQRQLACEHDDDGLAAASMPLPPRVASSSNPTRSRSMRQAGSSTADYPSSLGSAVANMQPPLAHTLPPHAGDLTAEGDPSL